MTDATFENKHPRGHHSNPGSFGFKPESQPEKPLPAPEPVKPEPIIVEIRLEKWDGRDEVEELDVIEYDATEVLIRESGDVFDSFAGYGDGETIDPYDFYGDEFDFIHTAAWKEGALGSHNGPYTVRPQGVVAAFQSKQLQDHVAYREWALENWQPGTGVPHPIGGYTDVETFDGTTTYFAPGVNVLGEEALVRHRLDGPAYEDPELGMKAYYVDGKRHRVDGPAFVSETGHKYYFLNDVSMPTPEQMEEGGINITYQGRPYMPTAD